MERVPSPQRNPQGKAVIIVSHRPSTIKHVDRVVKMADGRAVIEDDLSGVPRRNTTQVPPPDQERGR